MSLGCLCVCNKSKQGNNMLGTRCGAPNAAAVALMLCSVCGDGAAVRLFCGYIGVVVVLP